MSKKLIFKVNKLDNGNGYVDKISTFIKNLNKIRPNYHNELKEELKLTGKEQVVRFELAGRYVVIVAMEKNWDVISMAFFDLKKDKKLAINVMESILNRETDKTTAEKLAEEFVFAFTKINLFYDANYDLGSGSV